MAMGFDMSMGGKKIYGGSKIAAPLFTYSEDFSGVFTKAGYTLFINSGTNTWTDGGAFGRITIQNAVGAKAAWSYDPGAALVDYDVSFKLDYVSSFYAVWPIWYVRVKDATHYIKIYYDYFGGPPSYHIVIDGTSTSATIAIDSIIKTSVRKSGSNVVITVYDDGVQIATKTISETGIESGTFGFGGDYVGGGQPSYYWDIDDIVVTEV